MTTGPLEPTPMRDAFVQYVSQQAEAADPNEMLAMRSIAFICEACGICSPAKDEYLFVSEVAQELGLDPDSVRAEAYQLQTDDTLTPEEAQEDEEIAADEMQQAVNELFPGWQAFVAQYPTYCQATLDPAQGCHGSGMTIGVRPSTAPQGHYDTAGYQQDATGYQQQY